MKKVERRLHMTITDLIKKMKTELPYLDGEPNGCYAVMQAYIDENEKTKEKYAKGELPFTSAYNRLNEKYSFLNGMFWGLHASGFITDNEREELWQELMALTKLDDLSKLKGEPQ